MATRRETRRGQHVAAPAALSVLAAVCATLIAETLEASPRWNLVGALLAAAVPPMISATGSHRSLRVIGAIAVTGAAVLFTYSGFTVYAYAAEQPSAFPLPPGATPPTTQPTIPTTASPPSDEPGSAGIEVTPTQLLHCTDDRCDEPVTIHSTGTAPLVIGKIELDGENAVDFQPAGRCENTRLQPGQECAFEVRFTPTGRWETRHARLVIYQNLPGPPSFLPLEGLLPDPPSLEPVGEWCGLVVSVS